jgi:hypothetical protein
MKRAILAIACAAMTSSFAEAAPQTLGGTVVLNISGAFRQAVTQYGSGECTGIVALVPVATSTTLSALSLLTLFTNAGVEQATRAITINTARTGFSCAVAVPYKWQNVDTAQSQMAVLYTVKATDPGGTRPGKTQRLLQLLPIPANGTTTTLPVSVGL